jgi:hypothetical protein
MRSRFLFAALAAAAALAACSDGSTSPGGNGRLTVQLTDAPGDLKAAYVKIDKIVLFRSDADTASADSTRHITLTPTSTGFINLLSLSGGQLLTLVNSTSVPTGNYSQMRLYVNDAYVVTNAGQTWATSSSIVPAGTTVSGTLKCPSCSQSGYKVMFASGGMTVASNSTVIIDFDVNQTFGHQAGNSGQWIMHPVLRATATTVKYAAITGKVAVKDTTVKIPTCGGQANTLVAFKPTAVLGTDTLTAVTDSAGNYKIANVLPGTYTLSFAKDITFTNGQILTFTGTSSVPTLAIAEGVNGTANYTINSAVCH